MGDLTPTDPGGLQLRVGDAERQTVVDALRGHYGAGRLDLTDFEARTTAALAARTRGDLLPLLADLPHPPSPGRPSGPPVREPTSGSALAAYFRFVWLPINLLLVAIWFLTGGDYYFWPVWPMLGTGAPMLFMLSAHNRRR